SGAFTDSMWALKGVRALSWANKAGTVFKVNPVVLVASLVIGFAVEEGVGAAIRAHQYNTLLRPRLQARDRLVRGHRAGNDRQVFEGADALVRAALTLSAWLNAPISEALMEYHDDIAELERRWGEEHPVFRVKPRERTQELADDLSEIIKDSGY